MDRKVIVIGRVILIGLFVMSFSYNAFSGVTNGFFNDALNGWKSSGGAAAVSSGFTAGNPAAALYDPQTSYPSCSTLEQTFHLEHHSSLLSFDVLTPNTIPSETDHFYVELLDQYSQPLLGNPISLFHWTSANGWLMGDSTLDSDPDDSVLDGILVNEDIASYPGSILYSVSVPVDTLIDSDVTLRFRLENHEESDPDNQVYTTLYIDNIGLTPQFGPAVIPAPAAIGLAMEGLAMIAFLRNKLIAK